MLTSHSRLPQSVTATSLRLHGLYFFFFAVLTYTISQIAMVTKNSHTRLYQQLAVWLGLHIRTSFNLTISATTLLSCRDYKHNDLSLKAYG